jgi:hypothetical protein
LINPWQDLARMVEGCEVEQFLFGSWYICRGTNRAGRGSPGPTRRHSPLLR